MHPAVRTWRPWERCVNSCAESYAVPGADRRGDRTWDADQRLVQCRGNRRPIALPASLLPTAKRYRSLECSPVAGRQIAPRAPPAIGIAAMQVLAFVGQPLLGWTRLASGSASFRAANRIQRANGRQQHQFIAPQFGNAICQIGNRLERRLLTLAQDRLCCLFTQSFRITKSHAKGNRRRSLACSFSDIVASLAPACTPTPSS